MSGELGRPSTGNWYGEPMGTGASDLPSSRRVSLKAEGDEPSTCSMARAGGGAFIAGNCSGLSSRGPLGDSTCIVGSRKLATNGLWESHQPSSTLILSKPRKNSLMDWLR